MPIDTKQLLVDAFKRLAQTRDIDKITVKALINECHISRQTFYYHFENIIDLMEWSMRRETRELVEQGLRMEDMRSALEIFIAFTVKQYPLLQKLMQSQRRPQFEKYMVDSLSLYLGEMARHHGRSILMSAEDREVLVRYNVCGLVGVLLSFCGRPDLDQARLAAQLEKVLNGEMLEWGGA